MTFDCDLGYFNLYSSDLGKGHGSMEINGNDEYTKTCLHLTFCTITIDKCTTEWQ